MLASVALLPHPVALPVNTDDSNLQKDNVARFDSPIGRDSGYNSVTNSQVGSDQVEAPTCTKPSVPFELAGAGDLKRFDKDVDKATIDRFKDVMEQIGGPLLAHMQKSRKKYLPMAIRLMVLGKSNEDAKPCMVVFCAESRYGRVKRFFNVKLAKDVCRPQDSTLPSFDVLIVRQPPQPTAGTVVYRGQRPQDFHLNDQTNCGSPIKVVASGQTRFATLGGVIKVVGMGASGNYALYGMTAGHLADGCGGGEGEGESDGDGLSSGSDSEADSPENENVFSVTNGTLRRMASTPKLSQFPEPPLETPEEWETWGTILLKPEDPECQDERNYDWTLVEIKDRLTYNANRLVGREPGLPFPPRGELIEPLEGRADLQRAQSVVMISGFQGPKRGKLSDLPSMLLLAPGRIFVQTYVLALDDGSEIRQGDSGSWVVNEATREVYGHVVASDSFGGAYVVPLSMAFSDIKVQLRAESVSLPTELDIISERIRTNPELITVPVDGDLTPAPPRLSKRKRVRPGEVGEDEDGDEAQLGRKILRPGWAIDSTYSVTDYICPTFVPEDFVDSAYSSLGAADFEYSSVGAADASREVSNNGQWKPLNPFFGSAGVISPTYGPLDFISSTLSGSTEVTNFKFGSEEVIDSGLDDLDSLEQSIADARNEGHDVRPPSLYGYTRLFVPCDIFSLVLQGTGGGMASVASQNGKVPTNGDNTMIAGLSFQVFTMALFIVLAAEYAWRVRNRLREQGSAGLDSLAALVLATICIFARCVFRVAELAGGRRGPLMKNQGLFIGLEGVMVIVAALALIVFHPGLRFSAGYDVDAEKTRSGEDSVE